MRSTTAQAPGAAGAHPAHSPAARPNGKHRHGQSAAAPAPKLPITEYELTDICETVAVHFYGERALATPAPYADMRAAADAQAGPYWEKLMLTIQYYDLTPLRIASAIHLQVMQMMHERIALRARRSNGQWQGPGDNGLLSDTGQKKEVAVPADLAHWTLESDGKGCYTLTDAATGRTVQGTRLADLFAQASGEQVTGRRAEGERRRHQLELCAWLERLQTLRAGLARWAELTGQAAEFAALEERLDALAAATRQTLAALGSSTDADTRDEAG